jgi:hypothetical protein
MGTGNSKKDMIPYVNPNKVDQSTGKVKKNGYSTVNDIGFHGDVITFTNEKVSEKSRIVNKEEKKEYYVGTF